MPRRRLFIRSWLAFRSLTPLETTRVPRQQTSSLKCVLKPFVRLSPLGKAQSCRRANPLRCVAPPRAHRQCQISQATQISQAVISQWLRYKCVIFPSSKRHLKGFQPTDLTCRSRATDRYKGNNQWVDQNLVRHTLPRQQNALPFLPPPPPFGSAGDASLRTGRLAGLHGRRRGWDGDVARSHLAPPRHVHTPVHPCPEAAAWHIELTEPVWTRG